MVESLEALARALSSERVRLRTPMHVLTGEAVDVARFFERYYRAERAPGTGDLLRPGLEGVGSERLPADTAERINAMVLLVQSAQIGYQRLAEPPQGTQDIERARFVLSEITAALDFLFDDEVEDERDAQLAQVRRANEEPESLDALAQALVEYAALGDHHRDALDGFGDFDATMLDEAITLATVLRERAPSSETHEHARQALEWRNRLATVLSDEVARVSTAARFVFRHHPQLRREAASAYERRVRAARRRAAAVEASAA